MLRNIFIFIACTSAALLTSCLSKDAANSGSVDQSDIYQAYSVTYDAGDKELSATATFRLGSATGTTLSLSKPSVVSFNGEEMEMENSVFTGIYYRLAKQMDFVNTCTFVFVDTKKKEYINATPLMAAEIIDLPEKTDRAGGFRISWTDPLKPGETISLNIEDGKKNVSSVSTNAQGATSLTLDPGSLKEINSGSCQIWLVRVSEYSLKQSSKLQGTISVKYVSGKRWINLTGDLAYSRKNGRSKQIR